MPPRPLPEPSAAAYARAVPGARVQALCVHGYTGVPYEVRVVADALADAGVGVTCPLLPGHGSDPAELNRTRAEDWIDATDRAFAALPFSDPRVLVGSSMGALLMLRLAALHPTRVKALVLLAPALRMHRDGQLAGALSRRGLWRLYPMRHKAQAGGDVSDAEGQAKNRCYPVLPLRGVGELARLQEMVEPLLPNVSAPLCVFHGAQDHTIAPESSAIIAARVSSPIVERHVLRDSFHVIGLDVDRDRIARTAAAFVTRAL